MTVHRPILTIADMRAAEQRAIASDISEWALMRQAGEGAAKLLVPLVNGRRFLFLCGGGNNGGDGYVAAEILRQQGLKVRIAAVSAPQKEPARQAHAEWQGETVALEDAEPEEVLVDALFGIGLSRPVAGRVHDALMRLSGAAEVKIAFDVPSGIEGDAGTCLSEVPVFDHTFAFGALKPSHLLYPAAPFCGQVDVIPIEIEASSSPLFGLTAPKPVPVDPAAHKYQRGSVLVAAGEMPGAGWLAAHAAQRAGAAFVTVTGQTSSFGPSSLVMRAADRLDAKKIDAAIVGPGLGYASEAKTLADTILDLEVPLVIDGDMFSLFAQDRARLSGRGDVMTPHEGEFRRYFGDLVGSKIDRARAAAGESGNVIVLKGADTVIAAPDGRVAVNDHAHPRLAVAGSGDVLAGIIGAELAKGRPAFEAACAAVWRHGDAGLQAKDGMIAEDLFELIR